MTTTRRALLLGSTGLLLSACSSGASAKTSGGSSSSGGPLGISAIPDQDPEKLNRLYPLVADAVSRATGVKAVYRPVTDYTAVVRAFEVGDVHLAWMGGLTGVQARSRVKGARAIAQRDIDAEFHSLFIANTRAGIAPFTDLGGLTALAGHTFTFGSETSTSGRLMPEHFMIQAGVPVDRLKGSPGFSGSHDATIAAVASGSYEAGAVNEQVWKATVAAGKVDLSQVAVLWRTPGFPDYHWLARPDLDSRFGAGTTDEITKMLLSLDRSRPKDAAVLELFGATSFIPTDNARYDPIEAAAKDLGLLA